jgi:membrane-bound lytic murein transglycosylase D
MPGEKTASRQIPKLKVIFEDEDGRSRELVFEEIFCIGRDESCGVRIQDPSISRMHAEVYYSQDRWWIRDLESANGTYIGETKVERFPIGKPVRVKLGPKGPRLFLTFESPPKEEETEVKGTSSVTQVAQQYFGGATLKGAGLRTQLIRQAFKRVQKQQKTKYSVIIGIVVSLLFVTGGIAIFQRTKFEKHKRLAVELFYKMKILELQINQLKSALLKTEDVQNLKIVNEFELQMTGLRTDYDRSLKDLGVYTKRMGEEDKLILRVASLFGECEVNPPPGFLQEVKKYIKKWQSTKTLASCVQRARSNGYDSLIAREMKRRGLPPQFFYLAFQESAFDPLACGPPTSYGYAKGMWQFIPPTATEYKLRLGPYYKSRIRDPDDERSNVAKATAAAASYIRDLYETDAQASGLLVMASYNWGASGVLRLIRTMPQNPRERNFWALMEKYINRIPEETYNYVFSIFSAAVIGENPALFGFNFGNPLANVN